MPDASHLSRRERQIMDLLYARGPLPASEIQAALPNPPSNSAVRAMLRTLEEKGYVGHAAEDLRYVYSPVESKARASRKAARHLLNTFFAGSLETAVAALLDANEKALSKEDLDRLAELINRARMEGR